MSTNIADIKCRYCGSRSISRCGSYNHIPRYLCKSCGRKFKFDDNLFYMRKPPEFVYNSLDMYYRGIRMNEIRSFLKREYGYLPSRAGVYRWIHKFTDRAIIYYNNSSPAVGDAWIVGENLLKIAGKTLKIYDVVDIKTRFLLSTIVSLIRSKTTMKELLEQAIKKSGNRPKVVYAFITYTYFDKIKNIFGCQAEHISLERQEVRYNIETIEFIINIYEDRRKVIGNLKSLEMLKKFIAGWNVQYNYFQKQDMLSNKTPAESAGIDYRIKNWKGLVRL